MKNSDAENKQPRGFLAFFRRQDWEDFAMKFLAVFLGIVITFAGNAWVTHHREKQVVKKTLSLVCDELESDVALMDTLQAGISEEAQAAAFLQRYQGKYETCPADSMALLCNIPFSIPTIKPTSAALELMKSASLFQNLGNQDLALSIIHAYNALEYEKEAFQYFYDKKQRMLDEAMQDEAKEVFSRPQFTPAEAWGSITSTIEGRQFLNEIIISDKAGFGHTETRDLVLQVVKDVKEYIGE